MDKPIPVIKKRAFTIIELMVVVTIILILLSFLIPAIDQAETIARKAGCLANLHSVGLTAGSYFWDFQGRLPGGNATLAWGFGSDSTYSKTSGPPLPPMGSAFFITLGYLTEPRALYCPAWTHPYGQYNVLDTAGIDIVGGVNDYGGWPAPGNPGPNAHWIISYLYRSTFGPGANLPATLSGQDGQISNPALMADHWTRREVLYGVEYGHVDGNNTLYLDGSASYVPIPAATMIGLQPPSTMTHQGWAFQENIWLTYFE